MRRSVILGCQGQQPTRSASDVPRTASGGGFGPLLGRKPFKAPQPAGRGDGASSRKRKRVDYKGMTGDGDESGSDAEPGSDGEKTPAKGRKKNAKTLEGIYKGIDASGRSLAADNRKWDVFDVKPGALKKSFSVPIMRNKNGEVVETRMSLAALGVRRQVEIPPRPLHDPMSEHAIVLFDPTVDDRDAEKEKQALQEAQSLLEEKEKMAANGPHKSLAHILGLNKERKKVAEKVPVVIDPRLAKVLRPHQVEGVKVSPVYALLYSQTPQSDSCVLQFLYRCTTGLIVENAHG